MKKMISWIDLIGADVFVVLLTISIAMFTVATQLLSPTIMLVVSLLVWLTVTLVAKWLRQRQAETSAEAEQEAEAA